MARFTVANAKEMAAKSHAAKAARLEALRQAANPPPLIPPPSGLDPYLSRRVARVRTQLDLLDQAIEKEASKAQPDGQRLNWLAQAQDRLSEQERRLSGRPLPGSRKPPAEKPPSPPVGAWMVDVASNSIPPWQC